jgi:hypothetical protein
MGTTHQVGKRYSAINGFDERMQYGGQDRELEND